MLVGSPVDGHLLSLQGPLQVAAAQVLQLVLAETAGGVGERRLAEGLDQLGVGEVRVVGELEDLLCWCRERR